ncbi:MAG: HhoA/HhoB/HtrA family serine endopeptidase [Candidatus Velthaea sp.]
MKSRFFGTAVVGLVGAIVGSFSMMLFASTHFANVAGPGNTPPVVSAAPLSGGGSSDQDRIVNAVKRVTPSVVALNVVINGTRMVPTDPFAQLFGGQGGGQVQRFRARASGSGFVYSRDGLIVTNAHVVPVGTSSVEVVFASGERTKGRVYSRDPAADLALVKVDSYAKLPPPVELGNSDRLSAGQWAIAIGEPFELQQSVSVGVVSGFNRDETIGGDGGQPRQFKGLLQTSAPINPGNSGGPLIDFDGRLIGVNQSTASAQAGAQGIGFAIPVNLMKQEVAVLEKNQGQTINANSTGTGVPYLGVALAQLTPDVRAQINYQGQGVAVTNVQQDGPADKGGINPGDVITAFNGKPVNAVSELQKAIRALKPGQTADVIYVSSGTKKRASVKLGEAPVGYAQPSDPNQQP